MNKYLLFSLGILTSIGSIAMPLPTVAAPDPIQVRSSQPTIASLNVALQQNSQDLDAHLQRGILYARLEQNIPAIADYTQVIRLDPNHALAYNNRAAAKLNMKDYRGAYLDYTQVIRILPQQAITYNNRATARHQLGDCVGAIVDLKIAAALFKMQGDPVNYQRTLANLKYFQKSQR